MENKKRKIYVVGHMAYYASWMQGELVKEMQDADLVVFTGGEDVDPSMYDESSNPRTFSNIDRDYSERFEFRKAKRLNKKCIGICRGAQFLCVMSGGKLIQHQENPQYVHNITFNTGDIINITSTHHQAQFPNNLPKSDYTLIAWSSKMMSKTHQNGNGDEIEIDKEAEIVRYHKTDALCIQGHPEDLNENKYALDLTRLQKLLDDFINNKL